MDESDSNAKRAEFQQLYDTFIAEGCSPNVAAVKALQRLQGVASKTTAAKVQNADMEVDEDLTTSEAKAFSLKELENLLEGASGSFVSIVRKIGLVFSDPDAVTRSFMHNEVVELEQVGQIFRILSGLDESVQNSLRNALSILLSGMPRFYPKTDKESIVPILVAFQYEPYEYDPDTIKDVSKLCLSVMKLSNSARMELRTFWLSCNEEYLVRILGMIQMYLTLKVSLNHSLRFNELKEGVFILDMLYDINISKSFADYTEFYNHAVNELATENDIFLKNDIGNWFEEHHAEETLLFIKDSAVKTTLCDYPFILNPGSKSRVLQLEAHVQQQHQLQQALRSRLFGLDGGSIPYLVIRVHRDNLVDDVLNLIAHCTPGDLKKPLRVQFEGEEGVDEGGVRKEFFLLMVRQLIDPSFGMFVMDEDTNTMWFNPNTFEIALKFELVGVILGLAIYNGVILDLNFPHALYKKLLGVLPSFEDFVECNPRSGKSLQELLDFEGDVEDVFCRSFQVSYDYFGEMKTVELKENGDHIPVTEVNRKEYVDLYVDYYFNRSVDHLYKSFHKGFHLVCGGTFLEVMHPKEVELLIIGSASLDFTDLQSTCNYDGGFDESSDTIQHFWKVLHSFEPAQKQKFLMFTTGSDRVPIRGISSLNLTISRNGPKSDRLPTAHTCFNHLLLPDYQCEATLKERLLIAINHSEGFGTL